MPRVRNHTNPFNYHETMAPIDFQSIFQDYNGKIELEIGFGRGVFLREYAKQYTDRHIIGIDVRKQIVDILKERTPKDDYPNLYLCHGSGERLIEDLIPDRSLERVFIFHPDPWFKTKHHKRRIINDKVLTLLKDKLSPTGRLYLATDVALLWEDMTEKIERTGDFEYQEEPEFWKEFKTHWQEFSVRDQRQAFNACFALKS